MELNYEYLRLAIAIGATGIAAWQDARTSFIDERLTYGMIAVGGLITLASLDTALIFTTFGGAILIFAIGYLLYKFGQVGGGDVLLFSGLQMLLPIAPLSAHFAFWSLVPASYYQIDLAFAASSAVPFVASVIASSTFLALIGSAALYAYKLHGRKLKPDKNALFLSAAVALILGLMLSRLGLRLLPWGFFTVLFASAAFLYAFRKQIMDEVIAVKVKISEVEDEDVLLTEKMSQKLVKKYSLGRVLTESEVKKLRKIERNEKIARFPVAKDLPRMAPYVFASLLITAFAGDLILLMLIL